MGYCWEYFQRICKNYRVKNATGKVSKKAQMQLNLLFTSQIRLESICHLFFFVHRYNNDLKMSVPNFMEMVYFFQELLLPKNIFMRDKNYQ